MLVTWMETIKFIHLIILMVSIFRGVVCEFKMRVLVYLLVVAHDPKSV